MLNLKTVCFIFSSQMRSLYFTEMTSTMMRMWRLAMLSSANITSRLDYVLFLS